ncbi:hypothetical protein QAD02_017132 [Eretmocerus hayati]|uniref:Uncharacterized protein n=1 Tax=Eretmocerus hayati TaxID=131215 RepID=A0ACC2PHV4_9HYME|nr:hypothetical protein QAD02_017132 [Eretmocerus hayati]
MSPTVTQDGPSRVAQINCIGNRNHELQSGIEDIEKKGWCPVYWDTLSCWPSTPPGELAIHPCPAEFSGLRFDATQNATRQCLSNGRWNTSWDFSRCLLQIDDKLADVLAKIYYVGYTFSLVALIFAVAIYLYYRELKCLRNVIHTNLMFTYMLNDLLWIFTLSSQIWLESNLPMCIISYTLLQYFNLTNFFWMFVEGLYLYLLVVKTFSSNIKLRTCLFIGWGIPMIAVIAWAVVKAFTYDPEAASKNGEGALLQDCPWMMQHPFDWLHVAPALAVLCANVVFLFMIMWVLITKMRAANNVETQQYRRAAKALLVLMPLLGVTYIIVLCGPESGDSAIVFAYTRAVLLSTQGVSVAVLYCFLNGEVRNALRRHYDRWRAARLLGGRRGKHGRQHQHSAGACNGTGGGDPGGATTPDPGGRCTRSSCSYSAWAPRSRTESIRLCQRGPALDQRSPGSAVRLPLDDYHDCPVVIGQQQQQSGQQQLQCEPDDRHRATFAAAGAATEIDEEQQPLRQPIDLEETSRTTEMVGRGKLPARAKAMARLVLGSGGQGHHQQLMQNGTGVARTHRPRHL